MFWLFLVAVVVGAVFVVRKALRGPAADPSTGGGSASVPSLTTGSRMRVVVATLAIFFGAIGSVVGAAIVIYAFGFGRTEGDAMFGGAGVVMLVVALPMLVLGMLLRPRREATPPSEPTG